MSLAHSTQVRYSRHLKRVELQLLLAAPRRRRNALAIRMLASVASRPRLPIAAHCDG